MATAAQTTDGIDVARLTGSLGAEVRGIDLVKAGPGEAETILDLVSQHLVLFFPDQHLTPDQHIAFGQIFQVLVPYPALVAVVGFLGDQCLESHCLAPLKARRCRHRG